MDREEKLSQLYMEYEAFGDQYEEKMEELKTLHAMIMHYKLEIEKMEGCAVYLPEGVNRVLQRDILGNVN